MRSGVYYALLTTYNLIKLLHLSEEDGVEYTPIEAYMF